ALDVDGFRAVFLFLPELRPARPAAERATPMTRHPGEAGNRVQHPVQPIQHSFQLELGAEIASFLAHRFWSTCRDHTPLLGVPVFPPHYNSPIWVEGETDWYNRFHLPSFGNVQDR